MKTTVVNKRTDDYDIDIGRPGKWGNPFVIGPRMSREQSIEHYKVWLPTQPKLMAALHELKGQRLGCYCKPLACHGDVLAELADR